MIARADRCTGSRQRWSGMRRSAEPARQKRTVAASRASASSTSSGRGQTLGPRQGAVRLVTRLEDVPCPHAAALDPESEVRSQADRLSGARRVGDVPVAVDQRPRRRLASVVEDGLADELDLDRSLEAFDRAHEHVVGVVVGRRARVRRDLVLVVPRPHGQRGTNDDPPARRLPGRLEDVGARLVVRGRSDGRSRTAPAESCRLRGRAGSRTRSASRSEERRASRPHRPEPPALRCGSRR